MPEVLEPLTIGVMVTTFGLAWVQVNGPTEEVMSAPWLKAWACKVRTWFCETHWLLRTGLNLMLQAAGRAIWLGQAGGGELTGDVYKRQA